MYLYNIAVFRVWRVPDMHCLDAMHQGMYSSGKGAMPNKKLDMQHAEVSQVSTRKMQFHECNASDSKRKCW